MASARSWLGSLRRRTLGDRNAGAASGPAVPSDVEVDPSLGIRRISSFETLLAGYRESGQGLGNALDGGAGAGETAIAMLPHLSGEVYAFEPFPGNHRFFETLDERIKLVPKALAEAPSVASFRVSSVVSEDSHWGRERGMAGYSSVGRIVEEGQQGDYEVECVRADDVLDGVDIDFVKLDLQGAELNALKGMPRVISRALFLWVECTISDGLLGYLDEQGFKLFDTEYLFLGEPTEEAKQNFEISTPSFKLSTDQVAWKGFRSKPWPSYEREFRRFRREAGLVQTDLVCVHRDRLDRFERALSALG